MNKTVAMLLVVTTSAAGQGRLADARSAHTAGGPPPIVPFEISIPDATLRDLDAARTDAISRGDSGNGLGVRQTSKRVFVASW